MKLDILQFINLINNTDKYIEMIYLNGACYQFHLLLKKLYPGSEPYINKEKNHVITKFKNKYYDITGEVPGSGHTSMTFDEIKMADSWSFHKTKVIQIKECPFCEEAITI